VVRDDPLAAEQRAKSAISKPATLHRQLMKPFGNHRIIRLRQNALVRASVTFRDDTSFAFA
jgi:hypothetical protein